ncbi:bacteriocin [Pseudomonas vlassakiae]|uniref:bacteriocin n=1 Tax=Pseudomonas TaxID=286 RepID=UPI0006D44279|nr:MULTISPECIES: bacteriocin [Pseudomonas]MCU0124379.1 bacteriocin [Pseudomonas vlassakiae]
MNTELENLRTLDDDELEQVSGGISAFGYHAGASVVNYGQGSILHVSWGSNGGKYNFFELKLC